MKLKIDCVKDVLEELESFPIGCSSLSDLEKSIARHGSEDVLYTIAKLSEAKYINADVERTIDGYPHVFYIYDLTFTGHEFLNRIRSQDVWAKIKGAVCEGGTASLKIIGEIAAEILKETALKKFGMRKSDPIEL